MFIKWYHIIQQTFSIGYCIGIRYFWNVSVSAHRYIFYRKCIGVSIHFMLPILFWYYFTPFWPKYSRKFKFLSNKKQFFSIFYNIAYFKNLLTECIHTGQTYREMAKSPILIKLGWVDQLMGRVDHDQYFWPGPTLMGVAGPP